MILPSFHWSKRVKSSKERYLLGRHHFIVRHGNFKQQFISVFWCYCCCCFVFVFVFFYAVLHEKVRKIKLFHTDCSDLKNKLWQKIIYTWHIHKTEKFWYPINDVILKRGKELVKTVINTVWESPPLKSLKKINVTFNHKTLNADHVRVTSSKHTRSLASEGEFF